MPVALLLLAGCRGGPDIDPTSPVEGVVVDVDSVGITLASGFTIRTADGVAFPFVLGELENGAEFPPAHLAEHLASGEPVKVWFRTDGDQRVAYRIEDAPG